MREMNTKTLKTVSAYRKTGSTGKTHSQYTEILRRVKAAGLLQKTPSFYVTRIVIISALSIMLWTALWGASLTANMFTQLLLAVPIMVLQGVLAAQFGFIAHEASHRQVFHSNRMNDNAGRILANLLAGLSYGFWIRKHNKHHQKPNQIGADPDINIRVLSFTPESLEEKKGPEKLLSKNQGWLFPILLFFTSFDLLLDSIQSIMAKDKFVKHRFLEFAMMVVRQTTPFFLAWAFFQNPILAGVLWLVMMMSFGFFMGAAFAPNHKGMPLVPRDAKIDFFQRQVLTSRNIKPSWMSDNLMGGLNYQVEHHLFPSMPRPNLRAAGKLVQAYCKEQGVPFVEMGIFKSYGQVITYLNKVGLSNNRDPFVCPMIAELRPRN